MRKWLVSFAGILLAIFVLGPWLSGILFKRNLDRLLVLCNAQGLVHITLQHYQRRWLTSDIVLSIETVNTQPRLSFTQTEHVQHGPIIYHPSSLLPKYIALAVVHNELQFSKETANFLKQFNLFEQSIVANEDRVAFSGSYFKRFALVNVQWQEPHTHKKIQLKKIQINSLMNRARLKGEIAIEGFLFSQNDVAIKISKLLLKINQRLNQENWWVGDNQLKIKQFSLQMLDLPFIFLQQVSINAHVIEAEHLLSVMQTVSIKKIQLDDELLGSFQLRFSIKKLNVQALLDMFSIYQEISERGPFYQSELRRRVFSKIPDLINTETYVKLDKLRLDTQSGHLAVKVDMHWPADIISDSTQNLFDDADFSLGVHVSKNLVNEILQFASQSSYFRQVSDEDLQNLKNLQDNATLAIQQGAFLIIGLVESGHLRENDGIKLMRLIKNDPLSDEYAGTVKKLFLTKEISLYAAYLLYWQYASVMTAVTQLNQQAILLQNQMIQEFQDQLTGWVKQGFIVEKSDEYNLMLRRENGVNLWNKKALK